MLKLMDMLKILVGSKGWDYGVVWRISEDQRFLQCISCCCAGAENGDFNDPNGLMVSEFSCRDDVVHHQWNKCCELLSKLPSSVPLDSGIYAEAFFSGQPRWLHSSVTDFEQNKSDNEVSTSTRVLIPVHGRLVELFVSKQVSEDQNVVDYIVSQSVAPLELDDDALIEKKTDVEMERESLRFEKDLPSESNYQMNCSVANNGLEIPSQNAGRSDSISDGSDPIDDENDVKSLKTNGKGQAKNLEAERKRRKKLNERLYKLRALVPIISKLDKAHILVDAIEYVKQLRKQEQELKEELEQDSDNDRDELGNHFHQNVPNPLFQRSYGVDTDRESVQQMEAQVDVTVVDRSKFVVRVFCEQKAGGFVRLIDALNSLGLEVVNVNVTSCRMLVTNVFQVEMKSESNQVVADELKNSLLELTRIPSGAPDEMANKSENGFGIGYHYDHQHHFLGQHSSLFQFHN